MWSMKEIELWLSHARKFHENAKRFHALARKLEEAAEIWKGVHELARKFEEAAEIWKGFESSDISELIPVEQVDEPKKGKPLRNGTALIVELMRAAGEPIEKHRLFELMQESDSPIKSIGTLTSYLSKKDEFAPFGNRKWGFAEWLTKRDSPTVAPDELFQKERPVHDAPAAKSGEAGLRRDG